MGKVQNFFNTQVKAYDEHMESSGHYAAQLRLIKKIEEWVKSPILDVACGSGVLVKHLSESFYIQGNDFSEQMIDQARKANQNMKITCEDATSLSSYTQKFNTIICCNLFYYLPDKNKALQRWRDLLENEGKLILIEEFPFKYPPFKYFSLIVNPTSPLKMKEIIEKSKFELKRKAKECIDEDHNLHVLIFKKN